MDALIALVVAAIVVLAFLGILVALVLLRDPSASDAVTDDVVTKALTGPVPTPSARARLAASNRQAAAAANEPEPDDEAA